MQQPQINQHNNIIDMHTQHSMNIAGDSRRQAGPAVTAEVWLLAKASYLLSLTGRQVETQNPRCRLDFAASQPQLDSHTLTYSP